MYPNQQVQTLRKQGQLEQALQVGLSALQNSPDDIWLKRSIAWVYYDWIKRSCAQIDKQAKANRINPSLAINVQDNARDYARLRLERPDLAASNIMREVAKIAEHLPFYLGWCQWFGLEGFSADDRQPFLGDKGDTPSLLTQAARALVRWRNSNTSIPENADNLIETFLTAAIENPYETEASKVWLQWDLAKLYLLIGKRDLARKEMRKVIKQKSREFWIWREMAAIEQGVNSALELSYLCKAALCRAPEDFVGRLRLSLARSFLEHDEIPAAIYECLKVAETYQAKGWKFPDQLEAMMQSAWFDPSQVNQDQPAIYEKYVGDADLVIYDDIREVEASFLKSFRTKKNNSLIAVFVYKHNKQSVQILTSADWAAGEQPEPGSSYYLKLGQDSKGARVLGLRTRDTGMPWDCFSALDGVLEHINNSKKIASVFISRDSVVLVTENLFESVSSYEVGTPIRLQASYNRERERYEAVSAEPLKQMAYGSDCAEKTGSIKVNEKGFAFLENEVFISPYLVKKHELKTDNEITVLAIYKKKPNQSSYGWSAISVLDTFIDVDDEFGCVLEPPFLD